MEEHKDDNSNLIIRDDLSASVTKIFGIRTGYHSKIHNTRVGRVNRHFTLSSTTTTRNPVFKKQRIHVGKDQVEIKYVCSTGKEGLLPGSMAQFLSTLPVQLA